MVKKHIDNNICMSWLNQQNKNTRCHRYTCKNSDFCQYHKRYSNYMPNILNNSIIDDVSYEFLDENFDENLLGIYDSWKEVPEKYWIKLNDKWWDSRILIDIFSSQLITSEMENPKPTYPHDPFTRRNFTPIELYSLKTHCKKNKQKIYMVLAKFLYIDLDSIYKQEYGTSYEMSNILIDYISREFRYKLMCNKNSQDCYNGYWVPKDWDLSSFEKIYNYYNSLPYQVYVYDNDDDDYYITDNAHKNNVKNILESFTVENFNLNSDDICTNI